MSLFLLPFCSLLPALSLLLLLLLVLLHILGCFRGTQMKQQNGPKSPSLALDSESNQALERHNNVKMACYCCSRRGCNKNIFGQKWPLSETTKVGVPLGPIPPFGYPNRVGITRHNFTYMSTLSSCSKWAIELSVWVQRDRELERRRGSGANGRNENLRRPNCSRCSR